MRTRRSDGRNSIGTAIAIRITPFLLALQANTGSRPMLSYVYCFRSTSRAVLTNRNVPSPTRPMSTCPKHTTPDPHPCPWRSTAPTSARPLPSTTTTPRRTSRPIRPRPSLTPWGTTMATPHIRFIPLACMVLRMGMSTRTMRTFHLRWGRSQTLLLRDCMRAIRREIIWVQGVRK